MKTFFKKLFVLIFAIGMLGGILAPVLHNLNQNIYVLDHTVSDHGAVTTQANRSLKDFLNTIGTSKKAIIRVPHVTSSNNDSYLIDTSISLASYSNIIIEIENGALFNGVTGDESLTFNSPSQFKAQPNQQIFGSSITISFSARNGEISPSWWYSGSGNYDSAMSSAIASQPAQGIPIRLQPGHYTFSSSIQPVAQNATNWNPLIIIGASKNTAQGTIDTYNEGPTVLDFVGVSGFDFTGREAHYVHLENLYIYGNDTALTYGLYFDDKITGSVFKNLQLADFENGIRHEGTLVNGAWYCLFDNIKAYSNTGHGIYSSTNWNGTTFHRVISSSNSVNGILFDGTDFAPTIENSYFESNTQYGIRTTDIKFISIKNSWFEGNALEPLYIDGDDTELATVNLKGNVILTKTDNTQEHILLNNIRVLNSVGNKFQNDPANHVYRHAAATTIIVNAVGNSYYGITTSKIYSPSISANRFSDDLTPDLYLAGSLVKNSTTVSAVGPTDNVDVDGVDIVVLDTSGNNVTIGGFINGVANQEITVVRTSTANSATLEHNEATGNQDIFLADEADQTLATYGGWKLYCDGSNWYEIGY